MARVSDGRHPYTCARCGARGVRIFRPGGTFFRPADLRCAECVVLGSGADPRSEVAAHRRTPVQLCGYVAAVPSPDGLPWGITSIPPADLAAWLALPVLP